MNTLSRLQAITPRESGSSRRRPWQAVRIIVDEGGGTNLPRVTLSPGDRILIENRTRRPLRVAPVDFFGTAFSRSKIAPGDTSAPMVVTGLWFQVEMHVDGRRFFPLDIYLAPNVP
jgi:hypothetical protein